MVGTITYELSDFGLATFAGKLPKVMFTASGPGVKGNRLLASTPIVSIPNAAGAGTVTLESTDGVTPEVWYEVSIEHLQPGGKHNHYEVVNLRIYIPDGYYGPLAALPDAPLSAQTVLVSLNPPPPGYKGWYLNAPGPGLPPGDPDNPASSGTGILEIVS